MPNELPNVELFHKCVAVVLNLLYENFPNPIDIDTFYIEGEGIAVGKRALVTFDDEVRAWEKEGNSTEDNPIKRELAIYKNSIFYLRDEGYIRTLEPQHGQSQRTFRECCLTSKGLAALGRIGVKEKNSWGVLIHSAIREGKYKILQDLAVKALSGGLT